MYDVEIKTSKAEANFIVNLIEASLPLAAIVHDKKTIKYGKALADRIKNAIKKHGDTPRD